jgi:hypothetical protein
MSDDKYYITQVLWDEGCGIEEYSVRRYFYGFLSPSEMELEGEEEYFMLGVHETPFCYSKEPPYYGADGVNLGIMNDIHKSIPPLQGHLKSLFNLLDDDIHKNY